LKEKIENSVEFSAETEKIISDMKRNQNTFYNGKNPTRTLKIMREDNNVGFGNK
jgi:hypothetical protein